MTSSRSISKALHRSNPSRTRSNKAKLYIAIPPKEGWPPFTGSNWSSMGLRNKGSK